MSAVVLSVLSVCKLALRTACLVRSARVKNRHRSLVLSNRLCSSNFSGSAASNDGMSGEPHRAAGERSAASLEESYRRCFVGGDLSAKYKLARPVVPPAMVADIVEYANETVSCKDGLCVDVGCGPGQSTELFCPHFRKVVGTDISETQIGIARAACTAKNVSFEVSNAESLPFDDGTVALVSTVNALHWFRWDAFFAEVRRVLVDGGVFCPSLFRLRAVAEPGLEDCLEEFRYQEFKGYLTAQHDFWTYGYENTDVPFSDVRKKDFVVNEMTTLSAVLACVRTWSFVIRMEEKEPERARQVLERLETRIRSKLGKPGEDDPEVQVAYRASYILCRK
uniref:Methyltransferase n=1 Tax=Rhipicephalus appendiculatus TaxID=34631 RepID=A0A131YN59_RHIAP